MVWLSKNDVSIGDIIYISSVQVAGQPIGGRPFFVLHRDREALTKLHLFEVSSRSKVDNPTVLEDEQNYPYNAPIIPTLKNGLNRESHIKCDQLFIHCECILADRIMKIGELETELYQDIKRRSELAEKNGDFFYYDQPNDGTVLKFPTRL